MSLGAIISEWIRDNNIQQPSQEQLKKASEQVRNEALSRRPIVPIERYSFYRNLNRGES